MKKLVFILLLCAEVSCAQLHLPELSPRGQITQQAGYTTFEIGYGRPAARKRKIMGGLVPFKRLWRTGGGAGTTISFDQDVMINNKNIPAGIYAFVSIPDENEWTFMLNRDTSRIYGDPSEYEIHNEVVRIQARPMKTDRFYESLTFELDVIDNDAMFVLSWENTRVQFPIATGAQEKAMSEIHKALKARPDDPELLANAAFFYLMNNKDPEQILTWLEKAIALGGDRWVYHLRVNTLETMKRYPEARKATNTAIAFLRRTKPVEWENEISGYEDRLKKFPKD